LPAVAQCVVLFHLQDYAILGLLEHDPFVRPKGAAKGHASADQWRCFNNYDSQSAAQVSGFTYASSASARPFPCCFFHSDRLRERQGFLGVKVMRSFLDGLPAILDKRLLGECRFVDGYVEYVLSFSDLP
jgi:hypothetical protein